MSTPQHRDTGARVLATAASTIHDGAAGVAGGDRVIQVPAVAAHHVRTHTTSEITADLQHLVKRYRGAAILIAAVASVLVGRGFRKE